MLQSVLEVVTFPHSSTSSKFKTQADIPIDIVRSMPVIMTTQHGLQNKLHAPPFGERPTQGTENHLSFYNFSDAASLLALMNIIQLSPF